MVSVIILNYNSWEDTLKEVEQVHNILSVEYKDIIIIDNMSTNDSYNQLYSNNKGFTLIKSCENGGYAKGNNIGLRYSFDKGYDYSLIINNDILISDKEMLNKLQDVFNKDQLIATVNPDIYSPDGYLYNRDAKRPSFFDLTIGMLNYRKIGREIDLIYNYGYIYRPQGCCMMVDLKKMTEIGYFDEYTFLYNEEIILAEKLIEHSYKCACCIDTQIVHNHSKVVKGNIINPLIIKYYQDGFEYYLRRYRKFDKIKTYICLLFNYIKIRILLR